MDNPIRQSDNERGVRMTWKLDRTLKTPVYLQIAELLERSIASGEYPPGSPLPSERKLAEQLGVNRSTIVQAYAELRSAGLVESKVGSGTTVSRSKWGISPSHTPNWRQYAEGGSFLPNLPFMRRIRSSMHHHGQMIDMASGELAEPLFPSGLLQSIMQEQPFTEPLGYDHPQGNPQLRVELSAFLRKQGIAAPEASILVTSGSQQSLYLITQCLLAPGDAVAIEDPSYCYSLPMFQSAGLRICRLPVHHDGIDPDDIARLYREHRIRMLFLNPNYQNPTGTSLSMEKRQRVLAIAAELRIPIVEDDPFSLTSFHNQALPSLKALDKEDIVLYIGSLSKIAASGLRIGWLVAPQTVVSRLADARQQMDFGPSILPQWLAGRLLASNEFPRHLQMLRKALEAKQQRMIGALEHYFSEKIAFTAHPGGLNLWCKSKENISDHRLLEESIQRGLVFVPGSVYGSEEGFIRLSYARPEPAQMEIGIERLAAALRASLASKS